MKQFLLTKLEHLILINKWLEHMSPVQAAGSVRRVFSERLGNFPNQNDLPDHAAFQPGSENATDDISSPSFGPTSFT